MEKLSNTFYEGKKDERKRQRNSGEIFPLLFHFFDCLFVLFQSRTTAHLRIQIS